MDKTVASFCHWVAVQFPDLFFNFYLMKNHKVANKSVAIEAREKVNTDLESLYFFMKILIKECLDLEAIKL